MSAEDLESDESSGTTADLEALIAKDPERPKNGQMTNRMLRNLQDPEYTDPATKAAKESAGKARK